MKDIFMPAFYPLGLKPFALRLENMWKIKTHVQSGELNTTPPENSSLGCASSESDPLLVCGITRFSLSFCFLFRISHWQGKACCGLQMKQNAFSIRLSPLNTVYVTMTHENVELEFLLHAVSKEKFSFVDWCHKSVTVSINVINQLLKSLKK